MAEKRFYSRFNFTGELVLPKSSSKRPLCEERKTKDKKNALSMSFGVKSDENNMVFVEAFDSVRDTIKTMNADKDKIEIDWADRMDEDIVATVASYRKYVVNLGDDYGGRKEFISQYDQIKFLKETLPNYKGRVVVTGQYTKEWYEGKNGGKYYDHFKMQGVYAADEDSKNRLALTMDVYYNKDSVDETEWKESKKMILNGYIAQYVNKDEGTKYFPQQFVFSAAKYDPENESHQKILKYKLGYIKTKSKTMVHIPWELVLLRGAEEADFDESMLTDKQREQVELGIKKLEDFKPKGTIVGDRINEFRMFDPKLMGDFEDGLVDTELSESDFEEQIYVPTLDEKLSDLGKKSTAKKAEKPADNALLFDTDDGADVEDLF